VEEFGKALFKVISGADEEEEAAEDEEPGVYP
jgi:hypothetical protein